MAKEVKNQEWRKFVKIVSEEVENHPEVGFLLSIVNSLDDAVFNDYRHWVGTPSGQSSPIDIKTKHVLDCWKSMQSSTTSIQELVANFNESLADKRSAFNLRSKVANHFGFQDGGNNRYIQLNTSRYFVVKCSQTVDPISSLITVAYAVKHCAKSQHRINLDSNDLLRCLEDFAMDKYMENDTHPLSSDSEEDFFLDSRSFHPMDFDGVNINRIKNQTNGALCFLKVEVERIGDHSNQSSIINYSSLNKYVIIEFTKMLESECMKKSLYVIEGNAQGNDYHFLCQDGLALQQEITDYVRVDGKQLHELYKINVKLKKKISV